MNPTSKASFMDGGYLSGHSLQAVWIDEAPGVWAGTLPKAPPAQYAPKTLHWEMDTTAVHDFSEQIAAFGKQVADAQAAIKLNVDQIAKMFDLSPSMLTADGGTPPKTWSPLETRAVKPTHRKFSRREIVRGLENVVKRAGFAHRSHTNSTNSPDMSGLRCIQGELMLELGFDADAVLPGTYAGVAALLYGKGGYDTELQSVLAHAQWANDHHEAWGFILAEVRNRLALAA